MKLAIPYYSQYKEVTSDEWKGRACIVTCLKMALDHVSPGSAPSLDRLIEEALIHSASMMEHGLITAQSATHGFVHDVIVVMAHNHGVAAYREEFKSLSLDAENKPAPSPYVEAVLQKGIEKLKTSIENNHVPIVSVLPGLSDGESFHTILLTGFEEEEGRVKGFYYHDPDAKDLPRNDLFLSLSEFLKYWRKMAIFIG